MVRFAIFFLFVQFAQATPLYISESLIDGKVSQITKKPDSFVKAGEVIYYLESIDSGFSIEKVPVRAPVSGYLKNLLLPENSSVKKGEKLFSVMPTQESQIDL